MMEPNPPAVADAAALVEDRLVVLLGGASREDHDAAAR